MAHATKNCAYCGRVNADEAIYCRECGTSEFVVPDSISALALRLAETVDEVPDPEPDVSPDGETALCTYCLFPNSPEAYWCKRCGASVNFGSIVGPTDAAWASGYMWRGALRGHPKPFVMFGVWVLFLPKLLWNALVVWTVLVSRVGGVYSFSTVWLGLVLSAISVAMLYRVTKNYLTIPEIRLDSTDTDL